MAELLSLEAVTAGYADTVILEDISLSLEEHGGLALLGRNGVGKSTLLATIMGLTRLRSGRLSFAGADLSGVDVHKRPPLGLGYVPQEREIFPSLTVHENMVVAVRPGAWTLERVYDLFPRLSERRRNYGNQLSGGEQQMLAIARALVGNPKLLLLDEPFEGLAPVLVDLLLAALHRIRTESHIGMILVEQHAPPVLDLMPQAMVLDRGRSCWQGTSGDLADNPEQLAAMIGV